MMRQCQDVYYLDRACDKSGRSLSREKVTFRDDLIELDVKELIMILCIN